MAGPKFNGQRKPPMAIPAQRPFESRRSDINQQQAIEVAPTTLTGFVTIQGAGETTVDVTFPVWYIEEPGMFFGGSLGPNQSTEGGNLPTVSVVVLFWRTTFVDPSTYYNGARLAVVTTGRGDQEMKVHWHAEGRAITNPSSPGTSLSTESQI